MTRKLAAVLAVAALIFAIAVSVSGCAENGWYERTVYSMDTAVGIKLGRNGLSQSSADCVMDAIEEKLRYYEKMLSAHDESSDIYAFNVSHEGCDVSKDAAEVISASLELAEISGGRYDPTSLPLSELWNVAHGDEIVPAEDDIKRALSLVDYRAVKVDGTRVLKNVPEIGLDLGSIGKGYVLERLIDLLKDSDVKSAIVSVGGNVGVYGNKPDGEKWTVAMNSPYNDGRIIGKFRISDGFISVSGDYERYFESDGVRYHHIIDTTAGYPVSNGVHSVAVWCGSGMYGDGLSTLLFTIGVDEGMDLYRSRKYDFEAVFVTDDGVFMTDGADKLFTLYQ